MKPENINISQGDRSKMEIIGNDGLVSTDRQLKNDS